MSNETQNDFVLVADTGHFFRFDPQPEPTPENTHEETK